jgi:beta-galactosidase
MGTRSSCELSGSGWQMWRDEAAEWQDDKLHLPPVDVGVLPARPPTCGWAALAGLGRAVETPGTVEGYDWDARGDYRGVSWWWRAFDVPADAAGRRIVLQFEAVRLRAEVFVNERLVGYDLIGNTPFEVDISESVRPGQTNTLAVRVTDPGGNFTWEDFIADRWGSYTLPASHGFGGITGPVQLLVTDRVHVAGLFVKNTPAITTVDLAITLANGTTTPVPVALTVEIVGPDGAVRWAQQAAREIAPGTTTIELPASVPDAQLWDIDQPHLYVCRVRLDSGDVHAARFGFRWFAPEGIGAQACFRLNGRRIVLRTAISWSFWPGSGLPTRALAEKQLRAARQLGLNMLSFHRCIGVPLILDLADELGLLYYEEPGGYRCRDGDAFAFAWAREKLLRMVRRDRNHPALVIYDMINEHTDPPTLRHEQDMVDAATLDPTRAITFTSGWNKEGPDPTKLHMRPYDPRVYIEGWYDHHHAAGPGVYCDEFYRGPADYRLHTANTREIVFYGEEGAIATPPQLEQIVAELGNSPNGWDGADYRAWHAAYAAEFAAKPAWGRAFPTLTDLLRSCGNIALYYQGRMIENIRLGNATDGYAVNGWEAEKQENHSGVVDCFRNIKGDAALLAYYNQPLYVAVKVRNKVGPAPATITADFHLVNERDVRGPHTLHAWLENAAGTRLWSADYPVQAAGGETYGELLVADVTLTVDHGPGRYFLRAALRNAAGDVATGVDEIYLVDWRGQAVPTHGAVLGPAPATRAFWQREYGRTLPDFAPASPAVDFIVAEGYDPLPATVIPTVCLSPRVGRRSGLTGSYFRGTNFERPVLTRLDATLDFDWKHGPDTEVGAENFSVRWEGRLRAPETGPYLLHLSHDDGARLWLDGQLLFDDWTVLEAWAFSRPLTATSGFLTLAAGREYELRIEYFQAPGQGVARLAWTTPSAARAAATCADAALAQVRDDGATLVTLDRGPAWATWLAQRGLLEYRGWLQGGLYWLGSNFFGRAHPLLAGLPTDTAFNWEYQELARNEAERCGVLIGGEEPVVGFVTGHQHALATALGVVPCGRGRIVLCTLDLARSLNGPPGPADVTRRLLCNCLGMALRP